MLKLKIMITPTFQLSVGHVNCRTTENQPLDEGLSLMMLVCIISCLKFFWNQMVNE